MVAQRSIHYVTLSTAVCIHLAEAQIQMDVHQLSFQDENNENRREKDNQTIPYDQDKYIQFNSIGCNPTNYRMTS